MNLHLIGDEFESLRYKIYEIYVGICDVFFLSDLRNEVIQEYSMQAIISVYDKFLNRSCKFSR